MKNLLFLPLIFLLFLSIKNLDLSEPQESEYYFTRREPTLYERIEGFWGEERFAAYRVFNCESHFGDEDFDPKVISRPNSDGSIDVGLAQINSVHFPKVPGQTWDEKIAWLQDPVNNINFAFNQIYTYSGFGAWTCKKVL